MKIKFNNLTAIALSPIDFGDLDNVFRATNIQDIMNCDELRDAIEKGIFNLIDKIFRPIFMKKKFLLVNNDATILDKEDMMYNYIRDISCNFDRNVSRQISQPTWINIWDNILRQLRSLIAEKYKLPIKIREEE